MSVEVRSQLGGTDLSSPGGGSSGDSTNPSTTEGGSSGDEPKPHAVTSFSKGVQKAGDVVKDLTVILTSKEFQGIESAIVDAIAN
ncbi:hypothetical protein U1Q18_051302 [Sarracenia purpurea var. burkii]